MKDCKAQRDNEAGDIIVEATMIFPIVILSVLALFFASLFMAQKANLQANLQNALIYFKASETDTFVSPLEHVQYNRNDGRYGAVGNIYDPPGEGQVDGARMFPYRFLGMRFNETKFREYFFESCGNMFFYDGTNVTLDVQTTNWVIYKKISATATQTMTIPIDTRIIGIDPDIEISATAEVVVMDGDNFVRSADMVVYMYQKSELKDYIEPIISKGVEFYNKFKEIFGVGE